MSILYLNDNMFFLENLFLMSILQCPFSNVPFSNVLFSNVRYAETIIVRGFIKWSCPDQKTARTQLFSKETLTLLSNTTLQKSDGT